MAVEITCTVNGKQVSLRVEPTETLVDSLRLRLGLTGTKKACGTGDCGACTVLVDGEALRSCILLTASMQGKNIVTIEGLGTPADLHPIQEAFIEAGGIQCGFCTPGMILTIKALLDKNPNPGREEVKDALSGNLCRCTGYVKILDSVRLAVEKMAQ
jgi:carbon-monoxide dehydrogenase small subunit